MFALDLYKWCESYTGFNRQHLAKFIYAHRECARMAKAIGITPHEFASIYSKEFIGKALARGYLDMKDGVMNCKGSMKRPSIMDREIELMRDSQLIRLILDIDSLSDEELFSD